MSFPFSQQNNQAMQMQLQQEQYHSQEIIKTLSTIYSFQNQYELGALIQLLNQQQQEIQQEMDKVSQNDPTALKQNQEQYANIQKRCWDLKQSNQKLLIKILNMKQRISNQMYMHRQTNPVLSREMDLILEKIREVKLDITNKATRIRMKRECTKPVEKSPAPLKIALVELKSATEILSKQALKYREELGLVIRQVHNQAL